MHKNYPYLYLIHRTQEPTDASESKINVALRSWASFPNANHPSSDDYFENGSRTQLCKFFRLVVSCQMPLWQIFGSSRFAYTRNGRYNNKLNLPSTEDDPEEFVPDDAKEDYNTSPRKIAVPEGYKFHGIGRNSMSGIRVKVGMFVSLYAESVIAGPSK